MIGNYFGPPVTNDNLVPLTNDVIADLWASDYEHFRFTNNVNATALADNVAIAEEGKVIIPPVNAFQPPVGPRLATELLRANVAVSWISPSPGFVLQQADRLIGSPNNWLDVTNATELAGESNIVTISRMTDITNQLFRARQR